MVDAMVQILGLTMAGLSAFPFRPLSPGHPRLFGFPQNDRKPGMMGFSPVLVRAPQYPDIQTSRFSSSESVCPPEWEV